MFSDEEIVKMAAEIDKQLEKLKLQQQSNQTPLKSDDGKLELPKKQNDAIANATKEPTENFLKKFGRVAKADLCEKGGKLNAKWVEWGELETKDMLIAFGALFPSLGIEGSIAVTVAISISVIILHIGVKTFCEEYGNHE
jgi:hypothetical protein